VHSRMGGGTFFNMHTLSSVAVDVHIFYFPSDSQFSRSRFPCYYWTTEIRKESNTLPSSPYHSLFHSTCWIYLLFPRGYDAIFFRSFSLSLFLSLSLLLTTITTTYLVLFRRILNAMRIHTTFRLYIFFLLHHHYIFISSHTRK
jgi:hypothetical protein